MAAIDWYQMLINSQISLDDYCQFAGIEKGSTQYLDLAEALDSRKVLELVPKQSTFDDLSSALNNSARNDAANSIIDSLNESVKKNGASSIIDGINSNTEGNVNRVYSKSGEIIEFYVDSAEKTNKTTGAYDGGLTISEPINAIDDAGEVVLEKSAGRNNLGAKVDGFLGTISSVFATVSILNMVGKLVSKPLYNLEKEVFGYDMYQLDPDYFDNLYAGDTSAIALVQNVIWNLNPENNELTMYIDDRFAAGIVGYLTRKGWFNLDDTTYSRPLDSTVNVVGLNYPVPVISNIYIEDHESDNTVYAYRINNPASGKIISVAITQESSIGTFYTAHFWYVSKINDSDDVTFEKIKFVDDERQPAYHETVSAFLDSSNTYRETVGGVDVYYRKVNAVSNYFGDEEPNPLTVDYMERAAFNWNSLDEPNAYRKLVAKAGYMVLYGISSDPSQVDGLTDQTEAKIFTTPGTDASYSLIQRELQFDYPEIWTRSLKRGILDDEGSIKTRTYIPVPIPNGSPATAPDISTGTSRQNDLNTAVKNLPSNVAASLPNTASKPNNATKNPPSTDIGATPFQPETHGEASALWSVYNPTQSEIDSFGTWLWSSSFIDQVGKLFFEPMQAIIGLHKVFCSPSVSGKTSIKVGYLNSGVSANKVSSQYVNVNCGSVSVDEYFGNVFDYSPYTTVDLYLPFVGVVQLDTADVMRSTVTVSYGIDVFTGDCLAKVRVARGSSNAILYSYPGNCAVRYPISSGSYMSIVGYAAGAAATLISQNIGFFGAVSGLFGNRPSVQRGGSFSGNSGATGPKIPYLIISRPQSEVALNFNSYEGYPVNTTQKIGDCRGYIRIKEVHLNNISATDDELTMIEELLKDGVIVQSD